MPSARDARAGGAYVELSLRNAAFVKGLRGALGQLRAFGATVQSIGAGVSAAGMRLMKYGAGIVAPLLLSARAFGKVGAQLDRMYQSTGVAVEALSEISYAAEISETSIEAVELGIKKMQKVIAGGKGPENLMKGLGGLSPDKQLETIGDRINAISDPVEKAAAAIDIFGRSGTQLIPLLASLKELRAEARRKGLVISAADVEAAGKFDDALDRLWFTAKRVRDAIGASLAPMLTELAGDITDIAVTTGKWIRNNQGLIVSILKIGTAVLGAGVLLSSLGGIITAAGTSIVAFSAVGSAALAFLLSPIGMTVAAVSLLGAEILYLTGFAGDTLKGLGEKFASLKDFALKSFKGISDAMSAGNLSLAADILWKSIKVVWIEAINTLKGFWIDFKIWFVDIFGRTFWTGVSVAIQAISYLAKAWNEWKRLESGDTIKELVASRDQDRIDEETARWKQDVRNAAKRKTWGEGALHNVKNQGEVEAELKRIDIVGMKAKQDIGDKLLKETVQPITKFDDLQKGIDSARDKALQAIADKEIQTPASLAKEKADQLAKANKELADAMGKLKNSIDKARDEKTDVDLTSFLRDALTLPSGMEDLMPGLQVDALGTSSINEWIKGYEAMNISPPEIEKQIRRDLDVSGMFGSEAADRMGVGSTAADRTAKAAEGTEKNTKRTADKLEELEGGLAID